MYKYYLRNNITIIINEYMYINNNVYNNAPNVINIHTRTHTHTHIHTHTHTHHTRTTTTTTTTTLAYTLIRLLSWMIQKYLKHTHPFTYEWMCCKHTHSTPDTHTHALQLDHTQRYACMWVVCACVWIFSVLSPLLYFLAALYCVASYFIDKLILTRFSSRVCVCMCVCVCVNVCVC